MTPGYTDVWTVKNGKNVERGERTQRFASTWSGRTVLVDGRIAIEI